MTDRVSQASFGTWYLIERAGRRFLFMAMAFSMMTVMFILAGMVKLDTHGSGIVAAIMIFLYQAFFTWGWMAGERDWRKYVSVPG